MHDDFLEPRGPQGTHINTLKPKYPKSITFTLRGGFFRFWEIMAHGVAWRMRRLLYALSMYERSIRKEKKEYSIVEKGDKKVTVSVGDPKNTPAHCTH